MKVKYRKDRHTSSVLTDHMVVTPKFRAGVLVGEVADECERQVRWVCKTMDVKILQMAVSPDHLHLFLQYSPRLSVSEIVARIKVHTSKELRLRFPHLKKWRSSGLWAPGCYHSSVGQGFDVVEHYIAVQRHDRRRPNIIQKQK